MRFSFALLALVALAAAAFAGDPPVYPVPPAYRPTEPPAACVCGDSCKCKPGSCPGSCPVTAPVSGPKVGDTVRLDNGTVIRWDGTRYVASGGVPQPAPSAASPCPGGVCPAPQGGGVPFGGTTFPGYGGLGAAFGFGGGYCPPGRR